MIGYIWIKRDDDKPGYTSRHQVGGVPRFGAGLLWDAEDDIPDGYVEVVFKPPMLVIGKPEETTAPSDLGEPVELPCVLYDRGTTIHLEINLPQAGTSTMELDRDQARYLGRLLLHEADGLAEKDDESHEESLADA